MRRVTLALFIGLAALGSVSAANAGAVTDCPMRDAPFSESLPLIDIMLSPAARDVTEKQLGISFDKMPALFIGTKAPTFAAILTLHEAIGMLRLKPDAIDRADAALRALPVTAADKVARCVRYDNDRPHFTLPKGKPRLLLFEKINGFRDGPSVDAAHAAFLAMAKRKGWAIVTTDKGGAFTPATLGKFDVVIWNNISGDVLTLSQRNAFQSWIEQGGAFVGVHGTAGDPVYFWDWFVDRLIGARFVGHPLSPQFQNARVVVEDAAHPAARTLPREWVMNDEWYSFKTNPRKAGARVIATLDETTYNPKGWPGQELHMGDHPIAWTNCVGKGRMFYSAIGHRPESYSNPNYVTMLESAITWTSTDKQACPAAK